VVLKPVVPWNKKKVDKEETMKKEPVACTVSEDVYTTL